MPRPPVRKDGEELKPFTVAEHHIMYDFDGNKCYEGDTIMLTQKQAAYYQKTGFITFDLKAIFDDNRKNTSEDSAETSVELETEPSGTTDDGDDKQPTLKPKRRAAR